MFRCDVVLDRWAVTFISLTLNESLLSPSGFGNQPFNDLTFNRRKSRCLSLSQGRPSFAQMNEA